MNGVGSCCPRSWWLIACLSAAVAVPPTQALTPPARPPARTAPSIAPEAFFHGFTPDYKYARLPCGCVVSYMKDRSPPCIIRFADSSLLVFDSDFRARSFVSATGQLHGFDYDPQDRVLLARHPLQETVYRYDSHGAVSEIIHYPDRGRGIAKPYPKGSVKRATRTRQPHLLPHPHVPADSAMGRVVAGTWQSK